MPPALRVENYPRRVLAIGGICEQERSIVMPSENLAHSPIDADRHRKSIGLVLGSGSSRGWAHIGVIEALTDAQIPIDMIAGCSVGAYVGAIYASGGMASLKDFVLRMNGKKVFSYFDVVFPRSGLLDGTKKVKELFQMHSQARTFDDLAMPLMMVATDLESGGRVVLNSGDLLEALRAENAASGGQYVPRLVFTSSIAVFGGPCPDKWHDHFMDRICQGQRGGGG